MGAVLVFRLKSVLTLANTGVPLFLCYADATPALPQAVADPDFLALVLAALSGLCVTALASGWLLATALGVKGGTGGR